MLTLSKSLVAAADKRPGDMQAALEHAAELAQHTGEGNAYWMGFGLAREQPPTWLGSAVVSLGHAAAEEVWTGRMSAEVVGQAFRDSAGNLCQPS